jgi:hypothetical protein
LQKKGEHDRDAWFYQDRNHHPSSMIVDLVLLTEIQAPFAGMEAGAGGTTRQLKPHVKNRRN